MDQWIEKGFERMGEAIVGAKVEISGLHLDLFQLTFKWDRLQVTDPKNTMQNMVETRRAAFRINMEALLRKRVVIEEMTIADVRSGTPRKRDGALPKRKRKVKQIQDSKKAIKPGPFYKAKGYLNHEIDKLPVMQFDTDRFKKKLNLDSLIVMAELKIPSRLDSVRGDITQTSDKWETFYKTFHPEEDLEKIKKDFKTVEPEKINTIQELIDALEKVQSAHKKLREIGDVVKTKHQEIKVDYNRVSTYAKQVDDWYKEDYKNILEKARLPDFSVKNIGMLLFGKSVVYKINQVFGYYELAQKYIPQKSEKPKKEKKERLKGQNIHFSSRTNWPSFLIKKIHLSGQTGSSEESPRLVMKGEITGITSQPWIYGKPTIVDLEGLKEDRRSLLINITLDHTTDQTKDLFDIRMDNMILNHMALQKTPYLPTQIERGRADLNISGDFTEKGFGLKMGVVAKQLQFDFSNLKTEDQFIHIVRDVISKLDIITLQTRVKGKDDDLMLSMSSNLDTRVSQELKRLGSEALTNAQNKVRIRLNQIQKEKMTEVDRIYQKKRSMIEGRIEEYEKKVDEQRMIVETKIEKIKEELEARKKKEEDKLEDKAKDLLDDLLKG